MRDNHLDLSTGLVDLHFLTPTVMAYGLEKRLIDAHAVVEVALARYKTGLNLTDFEERTALLLLDEIDQLPCMLPPIRDDDEAPFDEAISFAQRVWIFLTLRTIRERWAEYDDPWVEIEEWLDEFGNPDAYKRFIYYEPAQAGNRPGLTGMLIDLDSYLKRESTALGGRGNDAPARDFGTSV